MQDLDPTTFSLEVRDSPGYHLFYEADKIATYRDNPSGLACFQVTCLALALRDWRARDTRQAVVFWGMGENRRTVCIT